MPDTSEAFCLSCTCSRLSLSIKHDVWTKRRCLISSFNEKMNRRSLTGFSGCSSYNLEIFQYNHLKLRTLERAVCWEWDFIRRAHRAATACFYSYADLTVQTLTHIFYFFFGNETRAIQLVATTNEYIEVHSALCCSALSLWHWSSPESLKHHLSVCLCAGYAAARTFQTMRHIWKWTNQAVISVPTFVSLNMSVPYL